jgi:hypothetical protein
MTGFGTAVAREAAWLTQHGDGLPALLTANGGPWDVIQAYMPRSPHQRQSQIYVLRRRFETERMTQQRRMPTHSFHLVCRWPIGGTTTGTGIAEAEQQAFDNALGLLVQRIEAFVGDKSHGAAGFLSVGESPNNTKIGVEYTDPGQTVGAGAFLEAAVTYVADDPEYVM